MENYKMLLFNHGLGMLNWQNMFVSLRCPRLM